MVYHWRVRVFSTAGWQLHSVDLLAAENWDRVTRLSVFYKRICRYAPDRLVQSPTNEPINGDGPTGLQADVSKTTFTLLSYVAIESL